MKLQESYKFWGDYLKHTTSLATGSLVLIATFLEKLFLNPEWKYAIVLSLVSFLVSIVCSVVCFALLAIEHQVYEEKDQPADWIEWSSFWSMSLAWLSFIVAVVSLTFFTVKNVL